MYNILFISRSMSNMFMLKLYCQLLIYKLLVNREFQTQNKVKETLLSHDLEQKFGEIYDKSKLLLSLTLVKVPCGAATAIYLAKAMDIVR